MLPLRMLGFLMLMFSLCDADRLCPTDINPLTLDPPEVIKEYEESVLVNCTSTEEDHVGMYWTVGNTDSSVEYDNSYIEVSLSNTDVAAECKIKLNDTHECSKDLKITVYKNPEMVSVFRTRYVPTVEGTPFELQCDIINVAPIQNLTVRWYKNNRAIRIDSFTNTTKTPVSESSTLAVNISREENGAEFRCEAQLDFGSYGSQPVTYDTYTVAVHYAPELKNKTEDVYVNEYNDVTLNCDTEGHPPPHFHWTCDRLNILENTNNLKITRVISSTTCNCTATNHLGSINKQIHVHVIPRGCPIVVTPAEMVVRFGDPASVNCSTDADVQQMGWEASVGATSTPGPAVIWTVEKLEDWQINPLCFINLKDTYQCSKKLTITLYKTPDIVSVSALDDGPMVEGTEYHLKCDIINVAPIQNLTVRWYKNNRAIRIDSFTNTTKTPVSESSTLAVNISREEKGAEFRCEAQLDFGPHGSQPVTYDTYTVAVHYAPELKNKTEDVYVNEYNDVTLNCDTEGHPPPHFHWTCDRLNILENINNLKITRVISSTTCNCTATNHLGSINKQIHVHVIPRGCPIVVTPAEMVVRFGDPASVNCSTDADVQQMGWEASVGATSTPGPAVIWTVEKLEDWQINPLCFINLKDTYQCSKKLTITLYKTPDIVSVSALDDGPMVEGTEYHLKCDIINVAPIQNLTVRWYKNNRAIRIDSFTNTTKTPVSESSTLAVNISRKEKGAEFRCEAQLDFGSYGSQPVTYDTYTVAVHYAPELKNKTEDVYVNEYNDVTLNCDAEGHPPPHFHWTCDRLNILENTNNLKITRVISSTTCNCTATNHLGSINKQIHVHVIPRGCPIVVTPAEMVVRFGDPASVNCSTDADVQQMGWEALVGATSTPGPAVIWTVEKLEDWQINPLCFINLKDTYQCSKKLTITLYKTPDIVSVSALDDGPMVEGTEYHLKCDIINVAPVQKLKVTWYRGNETVHTEVFNETSKVQANVSSTLRVTPVGDYNGVHFICKADLQLGQNGPRTDPTVTSSPYMAVVYYAPVFKEGTDNKEVNLGENVTIDCSAEGNPVPKILLNYSSAVNVKETTGGRQTGISITGATSTNAGVYSCDAINEYGRVTRYVTLTMKGQTSAVSSPNIWWLLIILIAVLILIILIILINVHNYRKKHGQYSFVPDKANDGSEIQMTPQSNGVQA